MESLAKDVVALLQYLLPGLLTAWIFYGLTSFPKPSQFERVVQALIFTLFIQFIVGMLGRLYEWAGQYYSFGAWDDAAKVQWSIAVAVLLGVIISYFANSDRLHKFLRDRNITKQTSWASEWHGVFHKNVTFILLHLKDERRLYGWPIEWPSDPTKGHFLISQPGWQLDDGEVHQLEGVENILIDVADVKWVEFMTKTWEQPDDKENLKPTTTSSTGKGKRRIRKK